MRKTKPVTTDIYQKLKSEIINFQLMPGQMLMVQQLAKVFNVSRTPVREAVIRLKEDGFVEEASGRKFRVTEITWEFINNLYEVRTILETQAIHVNAERMTKEQIAKLRCFVDKMDEYHRTNDNERLFEADLGFHNYILAMLGNKIVDNWMANLHDHQQRIRYLTVTIDGRLGSSATEHAQIVEYLEKGDFKNAESALRSHLESTVADIHKYYDKNPGIASKLIK